MIKRLIPLLAAIIGVVALTLVIGGASAADPPADTYVGVAQCATCHNGSVMPDVVTPWSQTGHGIKFYKETSDPTRVTWGDPAKTTYSSRCLGCHTVGFNTKVDENGFDDLLITEGWDGASDAMKYIVGKYKSLDDFKANSKAAPLANIQCENCHGPGRVHNPEVDFSDKTCDTCHAQSTQWQNSGHGTGPGTVAANPTEFNRAACLNCHSGEGFVKNTVDGGSITSAKSAIACATCHDPHSKVNDKQLRLEGKVKLPMGLTVDAGEAAACVTCHNGRRTAQERATFIANGGRGPHGNAQGAVLYGESGYDYGQVTLNSYHSTIENSCVTCHMAQTPGGDSHDADYNKDAPGRDKLGGHSWAMELTTADGKVVENAENACGGCHEGLESYDRAARGDYDGNAKIEGVQTEVASLLTQLATKLPKSAAGTVMTSGLTTTNSTEAQRKALWNYVLLTNDGSKGVHNTSYTVQLLKASINDLKGAPVTAAAPAAAAPAAPAALPKTGSPIPVEAVSGLVGMGAALVGLGGLFVRRRTH